MVLAEVFDKYLGSKVVWDILWNMSANAEAVGSKGVTRRQFLTGAGVAVVTGAVAAATVNEEMGRAAVGLARSFLDSLLDPSGSEASGDRFYLSPDALTEGKAGSVGERIAQFGLENADVLAPMGFDRERWGPTVRAAASMMDRLARGVRSVRNEATSEEIAEMERQYREVASACWALSVLEERYRGDKPGLVALVEEFMARRFVSYAKSGGGDLVLGEDLFPLDSLWSNTRPVGVVGVEDAVWACPTLELLANRVPLSVAKGSLGSGFARLTHFYVTDLSLPISEDPTYIIPTVESVRETPVCRLAKRVGVTSPLCKYRRPGDVVVTGTAEEVQRVAMVVERYGLGKLIDTIDISDRGGMVGAGDFSKREVKIDKSVVLDDARLIQVVVHEILGHGLEFALKHLPDAGLGLRHLMRLRRAVRDLRPYPSPQRVYVRPEEGESSVVDLRKLQTYANELYATAGPHTIYASQGVLNEEDQSHYSLWQLTKALSADSVAFGSQRALGEPVSGRLKVDDSIWSEKFGKFGDFYTAVRRRAGESDSRMTPFELAVVERVSDAAVYFDATSPNAGRSVYGGVWLSQLGISWFPAVMAQMATEDGKLMTNLMMRSSPTAKRDEARIFHAVNTYVSWVEHLMADVDTELFADVVAYSLMAEQGDITVSSDIAPVLRKQAQLVRDAVRVLVDNGMALKVSTQVAA